MSDLDDVLKNAVSAVGQVQRDIKDILKTHADQIQAMQEQVVQDIETTKKLQDIETAKKLHSQQILAFAIQ